MNMPGRSVRVPLTTRFRRSFAKVSGFVVAPLVALLVALPLAAGAAASAATAAPAAAAAPADGQLNILLFYKANFHA